MVSDAVYLDGVDWVQRSDEQPIVKRVREPLKLTSRDIDDDAADRIEFETLEGPHDPSEHTARIQSRRNAATSARVITLYNTVHAAGRITDGHCCSQHTHTNENPPFCNIETAGFCLH